MGPFNMGEAQHPSIRPNGRGGGLVRMDGETAVVASKDSSCLDAKLEGLEEEWRGSRHQGSAATLVFKQDAQEGKQVPARGELPEAVFLYVGQDMTHALHSSE